MKQLAVVVLHYGQTSLTERLHRQLYSSDLALKDQIFVLDNGAPEAFPNPWLRLSQNLYWAGALEYALNELNNQGYSHVWFLNNDLTFLGSPPFIQHAWARHDQIEHRVGPLAIYSPSAAKNPYHPQMVVDPRFSYRTVRFIDGIAPLINLSYWKQIGGVDYLDNPYGYGVDIWLSVQAKAHGWAVVVDHEIVVRHVYHSTAKKLPGFLKRAAQAEHQYLLARLGPDYRKTMAALAQDYQDFPFQRPHP